MNQKSAPAIPRGAFSIRMMLVISAVVGGLFFIGALGFLVEVVARRSLVDALEQRGKDVARDLADGVKLAMASEDTTRVAASVRVLTAGEEVAWVRVLGRDLQPIVSIRGRAGRPEDSQTAVYSRNHLFTAEVMLAGSPGQDVFDFEMLHASGRKSGPEQLGRVEVVLSDARVQQKLNRALGLGVLLILVAVVLFANVAHRRFVVPVIDLSGAARRVERGDLEARVSENAPAELGLLQSTFNRMVAALARHEHTLNRKNAELELSLQRTEHLYRSAQRHSARLATLNALARNSATSVDPVELAGHVASAWRSLFNAPLTGFWKGIDGHWMSVPLPDAEIASGSGVAPSDSEDPLSTEDLTHIARQTGPVVLDARDTGSRGRFAEVRLPLLHHTECVGILVGLIHSADEDPGEDTEFLVILAGQLAATLEVTALNESLRRSLDELGRAQDTMVRSEKVRAIGEMASGVAHGFNNVLAAVIGRVQLMQMRLDSGHLDPAYLKSGLAVVQQAAEDGARTVHRLQQYTRGTLKPVLLPVDLGRLIQEVVEMSKPRWQSNFEREGMRIEVRTDVPGDTVAAADESDLREVLLNLIYNAVDAMPNGGLLTLAATSAGGRIAVSVSDTGVGMEPDVQKRVFDPFFSTKGVKGNGLGLSIVSGIVKRLGGAVRLTSKPGEGTTFTIDLAAWAGEVPKDSSEMPFRVGRRRTLRCLAADDNTTALDNLRQILEELGHQVLAVDTGAAACRALREQTFDLVLTDLGMPEVNGWDVAAAARGANEPPPVVLCTGWGDSLDAADAAVRGVWRILAKPYRIADIEALLAALPDGGRRNAA